MTTSLYGTGTHVVAVERKPQLDRTGPRRLDGAAAHAVARPTVDGLEVSVCGVLVSAIAGIDWHEARVAPRCEECARIAG